MAFEFDRLHPCGDSVLSWVLRLFRCKGPQHRVVYGVGVGRDGVETLVVVPHDKVVTCPGEIVKGAVVNVTLGPATIPAHNFMSFQWNSCEKLALGTKKVAQKLATVRLH